MQAFSAYWNSSVRTGLGFLFLRKFVLFLVIAALLNGCAATHNSAKVKIEGVSLESPSNPSEENIMLELKTIGTEYVCLMPYGYLQKGAATVGYDNKEWQWWGERSDGIEQLINKARSNGLKVMLKPHIWIGWGDYTGDLTYDNLEDQSEWNKSYLEYLLHYAEIAERTGVELLCIGTELCMQLNDDPAYWQELINEVKKNYSGELTYASNWDCYQDFPFWQELDYIGIDAYFPLVEKNLFDSEDIADGWRYWKNEMQAFSTSTEKPILFTEYGYRSVEFGLREPWEMSKDGEVDYSVQSLGYEALFKNIWSEDWFAGGFLWKWHCKEHLSKRNRDSRFTPQGKPGLQVIIQNYGGQFLKKDE